MSLVTIGLLPSNGQAKVYLNLKETRNLTLQFAEFSHFSAAGVNDVTPLNERNDYLTVGGVKECFEALI